MESEYNEARKSHREKILLDVVKALQNRDFDAGYFPTVEQAREALLKMIPTNVMVGIGGSVTIRELAIIDILEKRGNEVVHHWKPEATKETNREIRKREGLAEYYLTSANAITEHGDIINIDGIGNRVAHMIFGPDNVIIVAGHNKIVPNVEAGIARTKNIAAVINAERVGAKTPCVTTGKCVDCSAPGRICRVTTIMQYRPWQTHIHVMLVNENLGF